MKSMSKLFSEYFLLIAQRKNKFLLSTIAKNRSPNALYFWSGTIFVKFFSFSADTKILKRYFWTFVLSL